MTIQRYKHTSNGMIPNSVGNWVSQIDHEHFLREKISEEGLPRNYRKIAKCWNDKKILFINFYKINVFSKDGEVKFEKIPVASYVMDKFSECYDTGDYEHLPPNVMLAKARSYARKSLGLIFEGDVNPITGNTYRNYWVENPQVNGIVLIEPVPFMTAAENIEQKL